MVLGGCLVGFLACEVGLRVAGIRYPVFFTFDAERGIAPRAGAEGRYELEGEASIRINSHGYRDDEHSLEKPPGVLRIAFLGDSFTEAQQVELEDTYWKRLEALLTARMPEQRVQTLGFGVGGYGTTQALLTYQKDARRFDPDLVALVMFLGNDLADNSWLFSKALGPEPVPSLPRLRGGRARARHLVPHARRRILQAALPHDGDPLLARLRGPSTRCGATSRRPRSAAGCATPSPSASPARPSVCSTRTSCTALRTTRLSTRPGRSPRTCCSSCMPR